MPGVAPEPQAQAQATRLSHLALEDEYVLGPELGQGTFGTVSRCCMSCSGAAAAARMAAPENASTSVQVRLGTNRRTRREVVIKLLPRGVSLQINGPKLSHELKGHLSVCHPHIVYLKKVFLTSSHLAIVLQYAEDGDLLTYLRYISVSLQDWGKCMTNAACSSSHGSTVPSGASSPYRVAADRPWHSGPVARYQSTKPGGCSSS